MVQRKIYLHFGCSVKKRGEEFPRPSGSEDRLSTSGNQGWRYHAHFCFLVQKYFKESFIWIDLER